ncbi:MAG: PAS domain S-box protein [Desulfatirhabdiaceae bacterium]
MKNNCEKKAELKELRDRANVILNNQPSSFNNIETEDPFELIENLKIHQIELEMQNDELFSTQARLETSQHKYVELYDFAPVGYVSMNPMGIILEINLTAADWLGFQKSQLISKFFGGFILPDFQDIFYIHCKTVLKVREKKNCDLKLVKKDGGQILVQMDTIPIVMENGEVGELRSTITDITERKRLENTLLETQKTIHALNEANSESSILLDRNGTVLMINEIAARRLGQNRETMIGLNINDFLSPEVSKERMNRFDEVISRRQSLDFQDIREERRYQHTLQPILDSKGDVAKIAVITKDITLKHQALDALVESEKKYRLLVNTAPMGIMVTQDRVLELVNPRVLSISGYSEQELISRTFFEIVHPDDRAMVMTFHARRLNGEEVPETYRMRVITKAGVIKWIENKGVLINWKGRPATLNFLFDITERQLAADALLKSEATLNLLLETIPIPVFYKDKEGRYLGFNKAFENFFMKSKEQLIGKSVFDISPFELAKVYHAKDVELFEKPGVQIYDSQVQDAHGVLHNVIFHKASLIDAKGSVTGLVGAILDITERKQAEEKIHELTHMLLQAQENERHLLSCELHDSIAQNLLALKIDCNTIYNDPSIISPALREKLAASSSLLLQTITAVRNLAYDLRLPGLEEMGLVKALEIYCEEASENGKTKIDFQTAGMSVIDLDENTKIHIYRLLQEGLSNIRKHADADHATILLLGSYPYVILRIEDNGRGFDVKAQERLSANTKRMGIHSMQERVYLLQGQMTIQSQPMKGTQIFIKIPLWKNHIGKSEKNKSHIDPSEKQMGKTPGC